jgi:hypothetical protein
MRHPRHEHRPTEQHHRGAHVVVLLTDVTSAVALACIASRAAARSTRRRASHNLALANVGHLAGETQAMQLQLWLGAARQDDPQACGAARDEQLEPPQRLG